MYLDISEAMYVTEPNMLQLAHKARYSNMVHCSAVHCHYCLFDSINNYSINNYLIPLAIHTITLSLTFVHDAMLHQQQQDYVLTW